MERSGLDHTLKIDIDQKDFPVVKIAQRLHMVTKRFDLDIGFIGIMETNKGFHLTLGIEGKLSDTELCFLQLLLCSDWIREVFNLERTRAGTPMDSKGGNIFFNKKIASVVNLDTRETTDSRLSSEEKRTAYCKLYEQLLMDCLASFGESNQSDKPGNK